jgi:hypothetical protein
MEFSPAERSIKKIYSPKKIFRPGKGYWETGLNNENGIVLNFNKLLKRLFSGDMGIIVAGPIS